MPAMPTTKHALRTGLAVLAAAAVPALAQPIAASAAPSAHFRVVATGFDVKTPTYDTIFQTDGKCDEVFLNYQTYRLTASGTSLYDSAHSSDTMGDINGQAGRIKAGSCSDQGGLRANDAFPSRNPWIETVPPAIDRN